METRPHRTKTALAKLPEHRDCEAQLFYYIGIFVPCIMELSGRMRSYVRGTLEVLWERAVPMTSLEVIQELKQNTGMTPRMVRVLMNRLCHKGLLSYVVDE